MMMSMMRAMRMRMMMMMMMLLMRMRMIMRTMMMMLMMMMTMMTMMTTRTMRMRMRMMMMIITKICSNNNYKVPSQNLRNKKKHTIFVKKSIKLQSYIRYNLVHNCHLSVLWLLSPFF